MSPELSRRDLRACEDMLRAGSKSFYAASLLLPRRARQSIVPLYAFCRTTDDLVDTSPPRHGLFESLQARLNGIYDGTPDENPVDRAMAHVVRATQLPKPVLEALLEGYEWDLDHRTFETLSDVIAYSARVAGSVGVAVTIMLGRRSMQTLSRACEMGIAMQLTNIARDVGEDARRGRLYLPRHWLRRGGLDIECWLDNPSDHTAVREATKLLVEEADRLYRHAEEGIIDLPRTVRPAIRSARLIYSAINRVIESRNYDSVSSRAVTSRSHKVVLMLSALAAPSRPAAHVEGDALPGEARFLIEAATS